MAYREAFSGLVFVAIRRFMLSNHDIEKFQAIYRESVGAEISQADAEREAIALVELMRRTYRPLPKSLPHHLRYNGCREQKS